MLVKMETQAAGGGSLSDQFEKAVVAGELPLKATILSTKNWTTDKAYKTVWMILEAVSSHDSFIKRGNQTGSSAFDAVYDSPLSGNRIYRFNNVASGTVLGTTTTTFYGAFIAFEE